MEKVNGKMYNRSDELQKLKNNAISGKLLYNSGQITREEAKELIVPYIEEFNRKTAEIAKKHGMKSKKISFGQFIR